MNRPTSNQESTNLQKAVKKEELVEIIFYSKSVLAKRQERRQRLLAQKQAPSLARLLSKKLFYLYVLFLLFEKERYGSEIIACLARNYPLWSASPGAVYPLLKEMEKAKLIAGNWEKGIKRNRCVYQITEKGRQEFKVLKDSLLPYLEGAMEVLGEVISQVKSSSLKDDT